MRSTFHNLEVARRGLAGQQAAIATIGHNIANERTPGYSRQKVDLAAARPIEVMAHNKSMAPGQLGTGVSVEAIKRIREKALDDHYRNEEQMLGYWLVQYDTLTKVEQIFNEPTDDALRSIIDDFWEKWQILSREPDNLTARAVLKETTEAMLESFQHADRKLDELAYDLSESIALKADEADIFITQIAELNGEIKRIEAFGDNANDLRDQRDLLVDQLSTLMQVRVTEQANGMYTITQPNGTVIVDGTTPATFAGGGLDVTTIIGGELASLVEARDTTIPQYRSHLESMLKSLIYGDVEVTLPEGSIFPVDLLDETGTVILSAGDAVGSDGLKYTVQGINGLHALGWSLATTTDASGNQVPVTGTHFFEPQNPGAFSIKDVRINQQILDNVNYIAASLKVDTDGSVLKGNGDLARLIAGFRTAVFDFDPSSATSGKGTFDEYYRSVVGGLGSQTREAERQVDNQLIIVLNAENMRHSVSGVDIDEELTNLIKFQQAYNASARMMTAIDEMLDKIINGTGIVGR